MGLCSAHGLLHFAFWHFDIEDEAPKADLVKWNVACDMFVTRFLLDVRLFRPPAFVNSDFPFPALSENELYRRLMVGHLQPEHEGFSTGTGYTDMDNCANDSSFLFGFKNPHQKYKEIFESALTQAVSAAVEVAAGHINDINEAAKKSISLAEKARRWFVNNYPLLGALAAHFNIVEDAGISMREQISLAAISESLATIYINPGIRLTETEYRFIVAHELLHVGLRHLNRCQGRDQFLWNVACDFVINGWLVEMGVGTMPQLGILYDPDFKDKSAEQVYDLIVRDIRRYKKLATLRGVGISDILGEGEVRFRQTSIGLDEFYRRALSEGLEYHKQTRGFLPLGLEEEIRTLFRAPIDWDVKLARWFDTFFVPLENIRTYSCLSRRQASTPDIPRPRTRPRLQAMDSRTFGVVLDTSGSMKRYTMAIALGTVASYASSRDVPFVRVVFCDASAYDTGYMSPEAIMGNVRIRGRGGTILQPGIDCLQKAQDFPKDGPILIITDGQCDHFITQRPHAIMLPKGQRLPFHPNGDVFEFE